MRPVIEFSIKELADRFDADMSEKAQALRAEVEAAIRAIPEVRDGESVTLDQVQPVIDSAVEKAVTERVDAMVKPVLAELDAEAITGNIKSMVEEAVAEIPVPKDGDSVTVEQVQPMIDNAVRTAVQAIPVPKDAADIADALIDRDGNLVLTLTDGRMKSLGLVVGRSVDQNAVEQSIADLVKKAVDAIPKPKDGDDGLGFDDMSVEHDGERTIVLRWAKGDVVKEASIKMPVMIYRGVWTEKGYEQGDCVTWGGSSWTALEDTSEKPGDGVKTWRLTSKKGRDGREVVKTTPQDKPFKLPRAE